MSTDAPDAVSRIVAQWGRERPDVDASPMLVIGRLHRLAGLLDAQLRPVFAAADLAEGEFDLLATLRRAGEPFTLTPTELSTHTMVTSGAITKRVDRLARRGLVRRSTRSDDARGRSITLTPAGVSLVDEVVVAHVANEERLLAPFTPRERDQFSALLSRWLVALEEERSL